MLVRQNPTIVLLFAIVLLSVTWSVLPGTSLRRAIAHLLSLAFVFHLVIRFRPDELLKLLAITSFIVLIPTWIGIAALPEITTYGGWTAWWKGFASQKNAFGQFASLAVITFFFVRLAFPRWRHLALLGLLLAIPCLAMSHSRSSWLGTLAGVLAGYYCYKIVNRGRITSSLKLTFGFVVGTVGLVLIVFSAEQFLGLLGRGLDFTQRTTIWEASISQGLTRPILGAGYQAFWTEAAAADLFSRLYVRVGNGHNAYLDLWLELGMLGLGAFILCAAVTMSRLALSLTSATRPDPTIAFFIAAITALFLFGVSEKVILVPTHGNLVWMLFLASTLSHSSGEGLSTGRSMAAHGPVSPKGAKLRWSAPIAF